MNCPHCGAEVSENGKYCDSCGASRSPAPPPGLQPPLPSATGQIVFSVINIVCLGGSLFGIVALVFAILATTARAVEEALRYLKIARVLNLVGIGLAAFAFVVTVLCFLLPFVFLTPFLFFMPYVGD
jgi:hypothetical protein